MNFFEEALASKRSTILHGHFGRNPFTVKFYLEKIPELELVSDDELIFWYHNRGFLYIFLEPPFNAYIPSDKWCIVLTSHRRLRWNSLTTRVVDVPFSLNRIIPLPKTTLDPNFKVVIPPTCHIGTFLTPEATEIDLSTVYSSHEAYLRLLTLFDALRPASIWTLRISEKLRKNLLKDIPGTGPYDVQLLNMLR